MKIVIGILIILAVVAAIVLIIALFVKKKYTVEREIMINKPKSEVFNFIKYLKNQDQYSVWVMKDPGSRREVKGTDGTIGYTSAWDSGNKDVGKGEQQITNIVEGERLDLDLHFIKPFEGQAQAFMSTQPVSDSQTKVKWVFNGGMNYPMNFMLLFLNMDKMLGKDLDAGLANLKSVLEK